MGYAGVGQIRAAVSAMYFANDRVEAVTIVVVALLAAAHRHDVQSPVAERTEARWKAVSLIGLAAHRSAVAIVAGVRGGAPRRVVLSRRGSNLKILQREDLADVVNRFGPDSNGIRSRWLGAYRR